MANIIIDTNIFMSANFNLNSASFSILDKYIEIFEQEKARIVLPNIILKEIEKKYKEDLKDKYEKYLTAYKNLKKVNYIEEEIIKFELDTDTQSKIFIDGFENELFDKFNDQIIIEDETKYIDIKNITDKCISGRKPFSIDGKLGFRDSLIWEFVKYYVNNFNENVIFITNDSDFINKKDGKLYEELKNELKKDLHVYDALDKLDLHTIIEEEYKQLIEKYESYFDSDLIEETIKDIIIDDIRDYVDFPSEYYDKNLTNFAVYKPRVLDIVDYRYNLHIIKIDFELNIEYEAYIFKSDWYEMNQSALGDFETYDKDYDEYSVQVKSENTYNIRALLTFDKNLQEIEEVEIVEAEKTYHL